jgi:membrane protease YdiL (CAAX protease family)
MATLVGALLAPPVFNALTALGRSSPRWSLLREWEFESVVGRCVLICLVLALPWVIRAAGFRSWRELGWHGREDWGRFGRAFALGALTMLGLFVLGWLGGAYTVRLEAALTRPGTWISYLAGAVVVGLLEETLFRGFYHRSLLRVCGAWTAASLGSFWFALVHFAKPFTEIGVVHARPLDGLRLVGDAFPLDHATEHYLPLALTLWVMGLVLCRLADAPGGLARAAGLHAGWVLVMRAGILVWDRNLAQAPGWYGPSDLISKSWAALLFALLWLAVGEWRRRTRPPTG